MKIKIPSKEVEACDVCRRPDTYLQTCTSCGGRFCLTCDAVIAGCVHGPTICRRCSENPRVLEVVMKYVPALVEVLKKREKELAKLRIKHAAKVILILCALLTACANSDHAAGIVTSRRKTIIYLP